MLRKAEEAGLAGKLVLDSAGTGGWHAGEAPDSRMMAAAARRGYQLPGRARQVTTADLRDFDLVLVMDQQNLRDLQVFDPEGAHRDKVRLFCEFCREHDVREVPDPYYGGAAGFDRVLDLLEDGCEHLIEHVRDSLEAKAQG